MAVRKEAMRRQAGDPQMLATDLAEYLTARGVPFREAHGAVARLMRHCAEKGLSPVSLGLAELRKYSKGFDRDIYARLTPEASVRGRKSPGGTSPAEARKRLRKGAK